MILERPPSPVALEDVDPENLSREELEELVRRQRVSQTTTVQACADKSQAAEQIKREHKSIKRERADTSTTPMPHLKSSKGANGEVIFHIDSDDENEVEPQRKKQVRGSSPADSEIEVVTL